MMINVFIVDGSATVRTALKRLLAESSDINVLGVASNPSIALRKMALQVWPDVIVSDLFLPDKAGIAFFEQVKSQAPTPFIFLSNNQKSSQDASIEALRVGASDVILKAGKNSQADIAGSADMLKQAIRAAARSQSVIDKKWLTNTDDATKKAVGQPTKKPLDLIAIGSSTGGTRIIERLLKALPKDSPPVLIVQHMPYPFTQKFAERLNAACDIKVKQAEHGEKIEKGVAYIAQGGLHLALKTHKEAFHLVVDKGPLVNHHRPSVDVLFSSIAETRFTHVMGVLLTGMGKDGAKGLLALKRQGNYTVAQHPSDCVAYGMPKAAIAMKATSEVLALKEIINRIFNRL